LKPSGLKVTQFSALMNIDAHGPLTTSSLAKILMLERTTLVRNLKLLESAGFIENSPSPDPRERQISITEHGRHAIGQAQPQWRAVQRQMKQQIGTERLQMLGHLVTALEGMADGQDTPPP
jgi:DNA-binding MarR family transcriptional regulator